MTFKSIVEHIIEREARQALEKVTETKNGFDFGKVEMQSKDKMFQNFAVDLKELGTPYEYRVIGFINDIGFVTPTHYQLGSGSQWYDIKNGMEVK